MQAALALFSEEPFVIYLDPDITVYGPLLAAEVALERADLIVTPHHLIPPDIKVLLPLLRSGAWNHLWAHAAHRVSTTGGITAPQRSCIA
jgi:hypothetical protein